MSPEERELWQEICLSVVRGPWDGPCDAIVASAIRSADKVVAAYREADKNIGPKTGEIIDVTPPKGRS